ncbi:DUF3969 family protein [Brevibacillus formosus]|uniref:DUF3969 family protein n=1 Tax=Brevibacillus TaxID=55080 RepID=UPI000D0FC7D2|nr:MULTISPECIES: DUF3969 family protein [Brevibacillus]MBG9941876.1 hypothetical protein [Brevibacillus formosus]MED1945583.1 DUF3969 family protein [Brevibacillus formosus]MED2000784.1 DUF3969 family protein [Brevibacillus formosus]MED2084370.1 DUF3969 family protein [Brevibacillus formosus]PSK15746.1 hypothetical protein C7R94_20155 [Brevibacillus sp. NRRL NRS-603]
MQIKLVESIEIQKFLCVLNIGMLDSLLEGAVTFEEAYAYLYRPYVAQLLTDNEANKEMIELFEECCMLEDIKDIAPNKLKEAIIQKKKETLDLLKSISNTGKPMYWLDNFDE